MDPYAVLLAIVAVAVVAIVAVKAGGKSARIVERSLRGVVKGTD